MKKIDFSTMIPSLAISFHAMRRRGGNPRFAWRVVLGGAILLACALALSAFIAYHWASNEESPVPERSIHGDTIAVEEIRSIIEFYKIKQANYRALLLQRPEAPLIGKNANSSVLLEPLLPEPLNVESSVTNPSPRAR